MATSPNPAPQAGPPPGGPSAGGSNQGQVLQLIAVITKASDALAQVFPAASPMKDAIQDQLQQVQSKINQTQSPSQPQAPPI
jgi:hypothetical protein